MSDLPAFRLSGVSDGVLESVSLAIPAEAVTFVIGPSRSGKSTLLELLAGREPAAGAVERRYPVGRIVHRGQDWRDLPRGGHRLRVLRELVAGDSDALLLDEPTKQLDEPSAQAVAALLLDAAASGRTIVAVTHDHALVRRFGGTAIVLRGGRASTEPVAGIDYLAIQDQTMTVLRGEAG